jgi:hypothetical protein
VSLGSAGISGLLFCCCACFFLCFRRDEYIENQKDVQAVVREARVEEGIDPQTGIVGETGPARPKGAAAEERLALLD